LLDEHLWIRRQIQNIIDPDVGVISVAGLCCSGESIRPFDSAGFASACSVRTGWVRRLSRLCQVIDFSRNSGVAQNFCG
jgi:hypothetical protein